MTKVRRGRSSSTTQREVVKSEDLSVPKAETKQQQHKERRRRKATRREDENESIFFFLLKFYEALFCNFLSIKILVDESSQTPNSKNMKSNIFALKIYFLNLIYFKSRSLCSLASLSVGNKYVGFINFAT